jgi:hypothetical protein
VRREVNSTQAFPIYPIVSLHLSKDLLGWGSFLLFQQSVDSKHFSFILIKDLKVEIKVAVVV